MKTTNKTKSKSSDIKALFRSPFIPSSQETDWAYSIGPGTAHGTNYKTTSDISESETKCDRHIK